jgi:hypothetical protein
MNRYFGGWKNGVFHGYGTFMYYDGTIFQGKFKSGQRKGKGTMYWSNGDALFGRWNGPDVEKASKYQFNIFIFVYIMLYH